MTQDPKFDNAQLRDLVTYSEAVAKIMARTHEILRAVEAVVKAKDEDGWYFKTLTAWTLLCSVNLEDAPDNEVDINKIIAPFFDRDQQMTMVAAYSIAMGACLALRQIYREIHPSLISVMEGAHKAANPNSALDVMQYMQQVTEILQRKEK